MPNDARKTAITSSGLVVGNSLSFSDTFLKLADAEIACLQFLRAASLAEPLFMTDEKAQAVRIIIVDESLLDDLVRAMPQLRAKFPHAHVALGFRKLDIAARLIDMVRADPSIGQVGFLPMNVEVDCWLSVLRLLVWGEYYIPASLMAQVQQAPMLSPEIPAPDPAVAREADEGDEATVEKIHLTERELQVLGSAAEGKQNKIIADELNLSQHTVKLHMHHVIAKLGVHNRTEAAIWYLNQYAQAQGR